MDMGVQREKTNSLVEEAYSIICKKICDFELYPGQELSDFTLSKELHMSRTPIRQALQQLEYNGLLRDAGIGKSYKVSEITADEIHDLFDAREAIEANALRLLMERGIEEEQLQTLVRINAYMDEQNRKGNIPMQFDYDQKFHNQLVALCGNQRLIRFYESLRIQLKWMRVLSYLERSYQQKAYNDHDVVLKEVETGNIDGAVQALIKHIRTSREDYCRLVEHRVSLDGYGMLRFMMGVTEET